MILKFHDIISIPVAYGEGRCCGCVGKINAGVGGAITVTQRYVSEGAALYLLIVGVVGFNGDVVQRLSIGFYRIYIKGNGAIILCREILEGRCAVKLVSSTAGSVPTVKD